MEIFITIFALILLVCLLVGWYLNDKNDLYSYYENGGESPNQAGWGE